MVFKIFSQKWLQIIIGELVLCTIIIGSAPLLGFEILSLRSLQVIIAGIVLSSAFIIYPRTRRSRILSQRWVHILVGGIILFALMIEVLRETGNVYFVPAAVVLGSFIVPVASIAYVYRNIRNSYISIPLLMACFVVGSPLGFVAAGFIESGTSQIWTIPGLFGIGFVEESVKLLFPIAIFISGRYRHEADGLLFGVASGMGFATLETMGDALNSLASSGSLGSMQWVLMYRSLLAPAMHAAWTGFLCAALWRQRERTGRWVDLTTIGAFLLAVVLHALWDIIASNYGSVSASEQSLSQLATTAIEFLAVMSIGLGLVLWRFRKSRNALSDTVLESD
jgi:protease PrsW